MRIGILFAGLLLVFASCNKGLSPEEQLEKDISAIKEYIAEHDLEAIETSSGLHYVVNTEGVGEQPNKNSDVRVRYKGYFLNGEIFDQSEEEGITFNLQQVIKGWTEGIPKFKEGGKGILLIPSSLGYGDQARGGIPANSVLLFDVDLLVVYP